MNSPIEPPPGCQEIPGYIVQVGNRAWLTQGGQLTRWRRRGVWPTLEEADAAREKFCQTLPK